MQSVLLKRLSCDEYAIFGELRYEDKKPIKTLELQWRDNQRNISCIPNGTYEAIGHYSKRFGNCYAIKDVPDRDGILIHIGNYHSNTQGCILVGEEQTGRGVYQSRIALMRMMEELRWPAPFMLTISGQWGNLERNENKERSATPGNGDAGSCSTETEGIDPQKGTKGDTP